LMSCASWRPRAKSKWKPARTKKMKWVDTILLSHSLRDVRLLLQSPGENWPALMREREQAAYERGRREGERALGEQLIKQRADVAGLQQGVLSSLRQTIPQVIRESEAALIELVTESVRKVVGGIPISVEMVEAVIREALAQVEDTAEVTVHLHPDDLALLRQNSSAVLNPLPEGGPLRFAASKEIARGGALVQTRFGIIDARRETKLEQLREAIQS
jgi:flagellar assembly protein FliH